MAGKRANGEGSIYQQADGRWVAALTGPDGRKRYYGKTRRQVHERLTRALKAKQDGLPIITDERQTVGQFLGRWLDHRVKPRVRPSTYRGYEEKIRVHLVPGLGKLSLAKLTPQAVQTYLSKEHEAGLSPRTCHHLRAILRTALNDALKWGLVARNSAALADGPRVPHREINPLNPDEARRLLEVIKGNRLEALVSVALAVGLRQGEALGLRWEDVDIDAGNLTVSYGLQRVDGQFELVEPKTTRSRRTIPLPAVAVTALKDHRKRQLEERLAAKDWRDQLGLVFTSPTGWPLHGPEVTKAFQAILRRAGLRHQRFHDLRHACASLLLAQGVPARTVMETLGHSTITLTMNTYSHVIPELQRDAAAKMDAILAAR